MLIYNIQHILIRLALHVYSKRSPNSASYKMFIYSYMAAGIKALFAAINEQIEYLSYVCQCVMFSSIFSGLKIIKS